jgi:chitinase
MIGQNDTPGEVFTLPDAGALARYATAHGVTRVSMWSANRDAPCQAYPGVAMLSNTCSGVPQNALQFTRILDRLTTTTTVNAPASAAVAADDPSTSPYPIWSPQQAYQTGYKVVWHRQVYAAKWFSQGQAPDQPVPSGAPSPWALLGPVLPGEHRPSLPRLPLGTYPQWSADKVYRAGARVLLRGLPYQAKWYSQGTPPDSGQSNPQAAPWQPLFTYPGEPR